MNISNAFIFIFISMLYFHIIGDWLLQNKEMNTLKYSSWWKQNNGFDLYRNDYLMVILIHSIIWSIGIFLPIIIFTVCSFDFNTIFYIGIFILIIFNTIVHSFIDNIYCNKGSISLITDQLLHILQIFINTIATIILFKMVFDL